MIRRSLEMLAIASLAIGAGTATTSAQTPKASTTAPKVTPEEAISRAAEELQAQLVEWRRDFHMYPELSNREERTSRVIAERLRAMGLDQVKTGVAKHGVVALLKGAKSGPVVAVRADMDALPVQETLDVPYKSQNAGIKHACGHDVHMSVVLGVAQILSRHRELVNGTVKIIFQPAEEGPPEGEEGGAKLMIREGALEDPRPQAIFGLHTFPALEAGQFGFHFGAAMAASDSFTITIRGKQVHGALPHQGVDAVMVAAECVMALQTIRSRRTDATQALVISVGTIHGGNRFNIIADEVKLEGTVRTLDEEVRRRVPELMRQTLEGVTSIYGARYELDYRQRSAVVSNDPKLVEGTLPAMRRALGADNVLPLPPFMASEDFSYYQQVVPGFFSFLGVGNKAKGVSAAWHTPEFDVDEESLVVGTKLMTGILVDYLSRASSRH